MNTGFSFAYKKSTQALNYFAIANGGSIDKLRALKLVFFADRYHLRKYGRPITNDQYWAMRMGPVASCTKELAELDSASSRERHYAAQYITKAVPGYMIQSCAPVDPSVFSESDREAIRFAWDRFGANKSIVNVTHQYPEWSRHAAALDNASRVPMDYVDFLEDPPAGFDPCGSMSDQDRVDRKEQLAEMATIVALWR